MWMLERIVDSLYASGPPELLYHFTSIDAVLKIVPEARLWATDIHYLDDASELHRALDMFDEETQLLHAQTNFQSPVLEQLSQWLKNQMHKPHGVFVACFSAKVHSLSQWQRCAPQGKGVSLGFQGGRLWEACLSQKFWIGKCVYDVSRQRSISRQIVQTMLLEASAMGPDTNAISAQSFFGRFDAVAPQMLQVASLFKSAAFESEDEWRAVSHSAPVNFANQVEFRPGSTSLIPHLNFGLPKNTHGGVALDSATVGPTPQASLAVAALSDFLFKHASSPSLSVVGCAIPHRPN